ncbi:MAG: hypothetical protein FWG05_04675 [Kiritimatiellaeota bacterium]|nr:hypothetical protein [Kiritimatiellota bacterium]
MPTAVLTKPTQPTLRRLRLTAEKTAGARSRAAAATATAVPPKKTPKEITDEMAAKGHLQGFSYEDALRLNESIADWNAGKRDYEKHDLIEV